MGEVDLARLLDGLPLSVPAAATLAPCWAVSASRRLLEIARTVPTLVFALIFVYPDISAILVLILLTVTLIDQLCTRLRHRILGAEALRAA